MNKQNDITINRLRVNAPKNDAKQVAFAFENQSLLEQYDCRKWLFVRELAVNGNKHELNQKISHLLIQNLQQGVHGGYSAANSANVVYFNNLPELLVFLLQDCINNTLLNKWYWYAWHKLLPLPKAEQVYTVLLENIEHLPSVTELLLEQKMIQPVWQQLTHSSAKQLLVLMQQRQPLAFRRLKQPFINSSASADAMKVASLSLPASKGFTQKIAKPLYTFRKSLKGLDESDGRVQLATELIIRMHLPVTSEEDCREITHRISESLVHQSPSNSKNNVTKQGENTVENPDRDKDTNENVIYMNKSYQYLPIGYFKTDSESSYKQLTDNDFHRHHEILAEEKNQESVEDKFNSEGKANNENSFGIEGNPSFYTRWGGFFYLINLLKTPKCQQLLASDNTTPNAWIWLFDLSRRLSCDLDQPLVNFIVEQAGFESPDELHSWLWIPEISDIFEMLSQYKKITQNPTQWLGINAKVFANKSHIDCYFSLDEVQLDVRMMGLDINPGWVPWLGRVVTFYYE